MAQEVERSTRTPRARHLRVLSNVHQVSAWVVSTYHKVRKNKEKEKSTWVRPRGNPATTSPSQHDSSRAPSRRGACPVTTQRECAVWDHWQFVSNKDFQRRPSIGRCGCTVTPSTPLQWSFVMSMKDHLPFRKCENCHWRKAQEVANILVPSIVELMENVHQVLFLGNMMR